MRMTAARIFSLISLFLAGSLLVNCTATDFGGANGKESGKKGDDGDGDSDDDDNDSAGNDAGIDGGADAADSGIDDETGTAGDPTYTVDGEGNARQSFKAESEGIVDIAFFVDTSGSMDEEIAALQLNMNGFLKKFVDEAKIDFQLFLVGSKDDDNDIVFDAEVSGNAKVDVVRNRVDSNDGLAVAQSLFGAGGGTKLKFREAAVKELIFVTDDDAEGPNGSEFAAFLAGRTDEVHVNGIVGQAEGEGAGCEIAARGGSYIELAGMTKHKGLIQDLCAQDWDKMLDQLSVAIESRVTLEFKLKSEPADPKTIKVTVDGNELGSGDFEYRADSNTIKINSGSAPKVGDRVVVTFEVEV